jgi:hypothetical protein
MKKRLFPLIVFVLMLLVSIPCFGAGSVTQTIELLGSGIEKYVLTFTWTGDSGDGTVPSTVTNDIISAILKGKYITEVRTYPGSTGPTALYDIELQDSLGFDVMGGSLHDRSATVKERAIPVMITGIYGGTMLDGALTLVITNNSVHSATGTVKIFLSR